MKITPQIATPDRCDVIYMDLDPVKGHEQGKHRPVLVLSEFKYNDVVGLCIVCSITNSIKGYPFEVLIPPEVGEVKGVILADQIRTLAWKDRATSHVCQVPFEVVKEVVEKLGICVFGHM